MSEIDVLAVMDQSTELLRLAARKSELVSDEIAADEAAEVRAAVSELIAAAKEVIENEDEPRFIYGAINSLRAALARIKEPQSP